MGGDRERITVLPLSGDATTSIAKFHAARAQCTISRDRERLLAVIEAGFGDLKPFDDIVRHILSTTVAEHEQDRRSKAAAAAVEQQTDALDAASLAVYTEEESIFALLEGTDGDPPPIALLDGEWLLARAEAMRAAPTAEGRSQLALIKRQELERREPTAYMDVATLRSLPRGRKEGGAALPLVCISHAWHGRGHPDPNGDNLLVFADAVRKQRQHSWSQQPLPTRFAVFCERALTQTRTAALPRPPLCSHRALALFARHRRRLLQLAAEGGRARGPERGGGPRLLSGALADAGDVRAQEDALLPAHGPS